MNKTTLEKIQHMIELQKELDERILDGKPYPTEQMKIALFVELGELMNELPTLFKHWKKTAVDNRDKALGEIVDCWHFAISLLPHFDKTSMSVIPRDNARLIEIYYNNSDSWDLYELLMRTSYFPPMIGALTKKLGFTIDEVYEGYLKKNKINHERQDNNY